MLIAGKDTAEKIMMTMKSQHTDHQERNDGSHRNYMKNAGFIQIQFDLFSHKIQFLKHSYQLIKPVQRWNQETKPVDLIAEQMKKLACKVWLKQLCINEFAICLYSV